MRQFGLIERSPQPGCREIRIEGELDLAVADQLREAFDRVTPDYDCVLIGLQSCEFIDSTGIAVIVQARQRLAKEGRRVMVYGPTAQVLRVLDVTGLTENGLVFESAEDALASEA